MRCDEVMCDEVCWVMCDEVCVMRCDEVMCAG